MEELPRGLGGGFTCNEELKKESFWVLYIKHYSKCLIRVCRFNHNSSPSLVFLPVLIWERGKRRHKEVKYLPKVMQPD